MKKMKKIFAALLTLAMVLGMSMTTFAEEQLTPASDIEVTNLAEGVTTDLELHKIIYLDKTTENGVEKQTWKTYDWVNGVTIDQATGAVTISDAEALKAAAEGHTADVTASTPDTTYTFKDVSIGGYVVLASDAAGTYGLMVANTYDNTQTYLAAKDAEVIAKWEGHNITKEASDYFVHRGQEVEFTVTTTFPPKTNAAGTEDLTTFKVIDKPTGLKITSITSITIGDTTLTTGDYTATEKETNNDGSTKTYEIDLSDQISRFDAGAKVVIRYKAVVYSDTEYNNSVDVDSNTVDYTPAETKGFEANITVTKVDEDGQFLTGAEFQVLKGGTALWFIETADGVYKQALTSDESNATQTLAVSVTNGTLKVTGLDEGEYTFKETKAPEGYSGGVEKTITVTADEENQVTIGATEATNIVNTKLSSLPSTGGIGTTIFTIGGCAIMIAAAGLFFASRRKESK